MNRLLALERPYPVGPVWWFGLFVITLIALAIRLVVAWRMPLLGDEVGTWMYMGYDYRFILTTFRDPWLSMGPYIAGTKLWASWVGLDPLALRVPVIVAATFSVPVMAAVVLRLRGTPSVALLAAFLLAVNPCLVSFGVTLRSYSMVVLFTLAALHALLRWMDEPGWGIGVWCGVCCAAALLAHVCTLYYLVFLGLVFVGSMGCPSDRAGLVALWRNSVSLIVPVAGLVLLASLSYWPQLDDMATFKVFWSGASPTPAAYIPYALEYYFAPGWLQMPTLLLLLGGWVIVVKKRPALAAFIGAGVAAPMLIYAASGAQHYPWGSARFLIYVLPLLIIQLSFAVEYLTTARWKRLVVCVVLVGSWCPGLHALYQKGTDRPWGEVAEILREWSRPTDAIIAPGNDRLALVPFFTETPDRLVFARDYLTVETDPAIAGHRLFLVTPTKWTSRHPAIRQGNLQITLYVGESRRVTAIALIRDLQENLAGRANPLLAPLSLDGLALMETLAWNAEEQLELQRIYYHSVLQGPDGLFLPPAQRAVRYP